MENASKAILIAGTILLVLAIIGIGMAIYSTANRTVENMGSEIDSFAIAAHNNKFNVYIGEVTGTQVLDCIQKVMATNKNEDLDARFRAVTVTIKIGAATTTVNSSTTTFAGNSNYKANVKYTGTVSYNADGIINSISFTKI